MTGPAPSPHEKALRFSRLLLLLPPRLSPLVLLRLDPLRLDERLWVRVAINSSSALVCRFNGWRRDRVPVASGFREPFSAPQSVFAGSCGCSGGGAASGLFCGAVGSGSGTV